MCEQQVRRFREPLQSKYAAGLIVLPLNTCYKYEPIGAYRRVDRAEGEDAPITVNDFKSYAEMGVRPRRGVSENSATYFGCSFFTSCVELSNRLKLPKPGKKIISVVLRQENGPISINEESTHLDFWAYWDCPFEEIVAEAIYFEVKL